MLSFYWKIRVSYSDFQPWQQQIIFIYFNIFWLKPKTNLCDTPNGSKIAISNKILRTCINYHSCKNPACAKVDIILISSLYLSELLAQLLERCFRDCAVLNVLGLSSALTVAFSSVHLISFSLLSYSIS